MKKVNRPGSLIERAPTKSKNFVDEQLEVIDQQLLQQKEPHGIEESKIADPRMSFSEHLDNKSHVLNRISKSLKTRRATNEAVQSLSSDPIHVACFKGNIIRVSELISKDPSYVHELFNLLEQPYLTESEQKDSTYFPPPQTPKNVRQAVSCAITQPHRLTRDQKWLIDNSFQKCSLLHYACIHDQLEIARFLLDQGIDPTIKNEANRTADFYTFSDEIKELIISTSRKKTQKTGRSSAFNQDMSSQTINALVKEGGSNKLLKARTPPPPPPPSSSSATAATTTTERKDRPKSKASSGPSVSFVPFADQESNRFAKFEKMVALLPEEAVRQKMRLDGLAPQEIDQFFHSHTHPPPPLPSTLSLSQAQAGDSQSSEIDPNEGSTGPPRRRLSSKRLSRVLSSRRLSESSATEATISDISNNDEPRLNPVKTINNNKTATNTTTNHTTNNNHTNNIHTNNTNNPTNTSDNSTNSGTISKGLPPPPPPPPPIAPEPIPPLSQALTLSRPVLAVRRLSVAATSNELVSTLVEGSEVKEERKELIQHYQETVDLVDKASLPVLNHSLPVIKPFKRHSILENMQDYLPSTTTTTAAAALSTNGEETDQTSSSNNNTTTTSAASSNNNKKGLELAAHPELSKEEKLVFHYFHLEKLLLKLVPLEDIANRVLIENSENDEAMMKKIIDNPSHYLQQMSSVLSQIRKMGSHRSGRRMKAKRTMTMTESAAGLGDRSPEKKLLAQHMIPTTIAATAATTTAPQRERLSFREMLWKRAADYMNRSLYDSTGPEFQRLRHEAYLLGAKMLQKEFKAMAEKEHWESVDLVQKKTIETILSLKHNLAAIAEEEEEEEEDYHTTSNSSKKKKKKQTTAGFLYNNNHSNSNSNNRVSFDELFEGYRSRSNQTTNLVQRMKTVTRQLSRSEQYNRDRAEEDLGQEEREEDDEEQPLFDADYYQYNIEEELEKLRLRFDAQDLAVFDQGRGGGGGGGKGEQLERDTSISSHDHDDNREEKKKDGNSRPIPPPPPPSSTYHNHSDPNSRRAFTLEELEGGRSGSDSLDEVDLTAALQDSRQHQQLTSYPFDRSITSEEEIVRYFQNITDR